MCSAAAVLAKPEAQGSYNQNATQILTITAGRALQGDCNSSWIAAKNDLESRLVRRALFNEYLAALTTPKISIFRHYT